MTDEMRGDFMGVAGHPVVETPALDGMAGTGFFFSRAYTPHPVCVPARTTLFTSRYGMVTGVMGNADMANQGEFFLPSILKNYGYNTAISGKLHFHPKGPAYGFNEFYSYRSEGPDSTTWYETYLREHFGSSFPYPVVEGSKPYPDDPLGKDLGEFPHDIEHYETNWIARQAMDFLKRQSQSHPWFLFVSFNRPHSPSVLPEPYHSMYKEAKIDIPEIPGPVSRKEFAATGGRERLVVEDPAMADSLTRSYMGAISLVDDQVALILKLLRDRGMEDNTIIVFTADHGNLLGDKGRWFKGPMWEGSSHIPLIIKVPESMLKGITPGREIEQIVELTDLMPTLLELIGLKGKVHGMQGQSLVPLLVGDTDGWRNFAFGKLNVQMMIVEGNYKFIHYDRNGLVEWEVFNLLEDPKETKNLAEEEFIREMLPGILKRMEAIVNDRPGPLQVEGMQLPEYAKAPRPS